MIEKVSSCLLDILGIRAGIYICNFHLDPGDELANRPTGTNNLFEGGIEPLSVILGIFELHQEILGTCLPNSLESYAQFLRFNRLLQVLQYSRVAHSLSGRRDNIPSIGRFRRKQCLTGEKTFIQRTPHQLYGKKVSVDFSEIMIFFSLCLPDKNGVWLCIKKLTVFFPYRVKGPNTWPRVEKWQISSSYCVKVPVKCPSGESLLETARAFSAMLMYLFKVPTLHGGFLCRN